MGISMTTYRKALSELTSLPEVGLQHARENDQSIIDAIINLQRQLRPGQVLILRVKLEAYDDNTEFESPNVYEEIVHGEPLEFIKRLREANIEFNRRNSFDVFPEPFPKQIEIVIPPDVISEEDLGINTTASRNAILS